MLYIYFIFESNFESNNKSIHNYIIIGNAIVKYNYNLLCTCFN